MINLCQSNSICQLKTWLVDKLCKEPLEHPFLDEQILVQSPGMAQWLQQQIASSSGIAAAVKFPMPASFIWQLFIKLLPGVPEVSAFSKDAITWKIMYLLPECLKDPVYAPLKHYLENTEQYTNHNTPGNNTFRDTDNITQVKAYQLAAKIADTLDQYLVYRPEWIKAWEQKENLNTITDHQQWQPQLWRKLTAHTLARGQSHWHRGNLYTSLVTALHEARNRPTNNKPTLPERLFIFGISTLPPAYLQVLEAISEHINVYLLLHNPCQFYWGDTRNPRQAILNSEQGELQFSENFLQQDNTELEESNSLLASMGKLGRDYHAMLSEINTLEEEYFIDPLEKYADQPATTLAQVQSQILNLQEPATPLPHQPEDRSLVINSCHSPLREAEVLHDHLLQLLESHPELKPRDIIIMAPDVETYSPAIQAVFSSAPNERLIPFAISDRNARRENPMLEALVKLLNLHQLRCTINDIMTLLEVPAIMRRYHIEAQQLDTLHQWVTHSGIRWGLNTEQQFRQSLPAHHQNTWQFGLERMLLGYAMETEGTLYENRLPAENIEGLDAALCGPLAEFIDGLDWLGNTLETPRDASEWIAFINQVLDRFFLPDETEAPALQMVRDTLTSLCEQTESAGFSQTLSHPVLLEWLTERLEHNKGSQRFLSGKVNVCTLMPMRSIPFKVICLLGMNDGAYPRSIPPGSFDLISAFPRRGDRSRRDDDRYLFLEALLAAEDYLYISYNGRDIKDDSERAPSVLLSELIDYCQRHFVDETTGKPVSWIKQHPLQPFSYAYFHTDSSYFTYAREWLPVLPEKTSHPLDNFITKPLPDRETITMIDLDELLRFYNHPCKYFFQQRLGINFEPLDTPPDENEPFSLNGLDNFQLQNMLLENQLQHKQQQTFTLLPERAQSDHLFDDTLAQIRASGRLPHSHFGDFSLENITESTTALLSFLYPYFTQAEEEQEIRLDINGIQLNGWIKGIYNNCLLRYRPSKNKNKFLVRCLIEHLAWCASSDNPGESHIFTLTNKGEAECTIFRQLSQQQGIDELQKFLGLYHQGNNEPLPFFPATSAAWIIETSDGFQRSTDENKLAKAWKKARNTLEKERETDDYIQRIWPETSPELLEQIARLSEYLLLPLVTHNKTQETQKKK